jgi:hypothetical protein
MDVRNQLLQGGASAFARRTPETPEPKMLHYSCSPLAVPTSTDHHQGIVVAKTVHHCGKSKMPAGYQRRTTGNQSSIFMFLAKNGKLAGTMMQTN